MRNIKVHLEGPPRRQDDGSARGIYTRTVFCNVMVSAGLVGLLLAGCSQGETSSDQTSVTEPQGASSTAHPAVSSPPPTPAPTLTSTPPTIRSTEASPPPTTAGSTRPPGPPVFDPESIGSNLMLPSFVVTVRVANTNSGQLSENITTTGFIKDPASAYQLATFSYDGTTDGTRSYQVDGRSYEENQFGDWYLYEAGSASAPDLSNGLDLRSGTLAGVTSARLAGQEDYAGIPANHFVYDETDLTNYSSYTPERPSPSVEGDFYLAQEGNYVLFVHFKESSPDRTYEVTEELSSIGQVDEITLPTELAPMAQALDIGVDLSRLLPPGASLSAMRRYENGIGVDYYTYDTPVRTNDEFVNFFRTLPPTDGWSVSHIGHVEPHLEQINCETDVECVILNNGDEQIVVSFGGDISIEYDREHVFSPI